MANKKKQNNSIYTLSGYAKLYVANGVPYGLMLTGSYEDEDGNRHYVNLWKKVQNGNVKVTISKTGNPALHLGMLDVETVVKNEKIEEKGLPNYGGGKNSAPQKRPELEEVGETPFD